MCKVPHKVPQDNFLLCFSKGPGTPSSHISPEALPTSALEKKAPQPGCKRVRHVLERSHSSSELALSPSSRFRGPG